jgi:hypothetical protein
MAAAFDESRDGRLSAEVVSFYISLSFSLQERAVMLTTVGAVPGIAALRLAATTGLRGVPSFLGRRRRRRR